MSRSDPMTNPENNASTAVFLGNQAGNDITSARTYWQYDKIADRGTFRNDTEMLPKSVESGWKLVDRRVKLAIFSNHSYTESAFIFRRWNLFASLSSLSCGLIRPIGLIEILDSLLRLGFQLSFPQTTEENPCFEFLVK